MIIENMYSDTSWADLRTAWQSLPPPVRQGLALAIIAAAAGQSAPTAPVVPVPTIRRRYKRYGPAEIAAMQAKTRTIATTAPTLPLCAIAEVLGVPFSSFKALGLAEFAKPFNTCAAPRSARRPSGEAADYSSDPAMIAERREEAELAGLNPNDI